MHARGRGGLRRPARARRAERGELARGRCGRLAPARPRPRPLRPPHYSSTRAHRRSRARPRRVRGALRPAAGGRAARGDQPARGGAGRDRPRLPRPPRGGGRARPGGGDRVPRPDRGAAGAQVAADAARRPRRRSSTSAPRRRPTSCSRGCSSTAATRTPARALAKRFEAERPYLYRSAPLPADLRRVSLEAARPAYEPDRLGAALGDLLRTPPAARHQPHPPDRLARAPPARSCAGCSRARTAVDFDEAFGGEDRLTQAVTIFALLEMHKKGEATWSSADNFGPISITAGAEPAARRRRDERGDQRSRARPRDRGAALPLARPGPGRAT